MRPLAHHRRLAFGPPAARAERGESLIEVMATVLVLGTGIAAILGALLTSTRVAVQSQDATKAGLGIQTVSEQIAVPYDSLETSADVIEGYLSYIPCAFDFQYGSLGVLPLPTNPTAAPDGQTFAGYSAEVTDVDYLAGYRGAGGFDGNGDPQFDEDQIYGGPFQNCDLNPPADRAVSGMQRITVDLSKDGTLVETVVIYKRNQLCPSTFNNADQGPC